MNNVMTMSQRADELESKMSRELDMIVVKSRLHSWAEGDMSAPGSVMPQLKANPNARVLMGDDPRLPAMPEKPILIDFFKHRFGPSAHLLGSRTGVLTSIGDMFADPFVETWPGYDPAHIGYVFTLRLRPGETAALVTFVVKGLSEIASLFIRLGRENYSTSQFSNA